MNRHLSPWWLIAVTCFGCKSGIEPQNRDASRNGTSSSSVCDPTLYRFDLDGDGLNDTNLDVRSCDSDPPHYCLNVDSCLLSPRQLALGANAFPLGLDTYPDVPPPYPVVMGVTIQTVGDYTADGLSEISLLYYEKNAAPFPHLTPAIVIFDLAGQTSLGSSTAPPNLIKFKDYTLATFTDFPRDPSGRLHPFLAPGYGDERPLQQNPPPGTNYWGFLCVFRSESGSQGRCGPGFQEASAIPVVTDPTWPYDPSYYFREVGGFLQPLDPSGWESINLIFHGHILAISPQTTQVLVSNTLNVTGQSGQWFHSGRLYGVHTAVTSSDNKLRDVILGAIPVDRLDDYFGNVSRFVTVVESTPGQPNTRHMAWTRFFGFHSNIYNTQSCSHDVARRGDFSNEILTRFYDGLTTMDGEEVIIVNHFNQAPGGGVSQCELEQCTSDWYTCAASNLNSIGDWRTEVLAEADGAIRADLIQSYVWGYNDGTYPGGQRVYLTEATPLNVRFNLSNAGQPIIDMRVLSGGAWQSLGSSPVRGRPDIVYPVNGGMGGAHGEGSFTALSVNLLGDIDGDGLLDVLFRDENGARPGPWIGWSTDTSEWVVKAYPFIIDIVGPGSRVNSISSSPFGLGCGGGSCSGFFAPGTQVTLQPVPASGYRFANFSGDPGCSDGVVTVDRKIHCVATFDGAVFFSTGANQTFVVPPDVTSINIKAWGAGGGGSSIGGTYPHVSAGGGGGFSSGTLAVVPGETLTVIVGRGGGGSDHVYIPYGGGTSPGGFEGGGGGGGRSAVRRSTGAEVITAGSGAGGGYGLDPVNPAPGGGLTGGASGGSARDGSGGSQSAGGSGGTGSLNGSNGGAFQGGTGANYSGGGGGGYYGGGGGATTFGVGAGVGGGGSSYIDGVTNGATIAGSGTAAANTTDPDYLGSTGKGGLMGSRDWATGQDGANGLVVITW